MNPSNLDRTWTRTKSVWIVFASFLLNTPEPVPGQIRGGVDSGQSGPILDSTRLFEICVQARGEDYFGARDAMRLAGPEDLDIASRCDARDKDVGWECRLTRQILALWIADSARCLKFHEELDYWCKRSYQTHSGNPDPGPITSWCRKEGASNPDHETLMLERLLKYDDEPHVRRGILNALGYDGTAQCLDPLIAMMNPPEGVCEDCIWCVARVSARLGESRAIPNLVEMYRTRPRESDTELPEELLRAMAPWPQRGIISAIDNIGGAEALRALQDLRADETHAVLIMHLEIAILTGRDHLNNPKQDGFPQTLLYTGAYSLIAIMLVVGVGLVFLRNRPIRR